MSYLCNIGMQYKFFFQRYLANFWCLYHQIYFNKSNARLQGRIKIFPEKPPAGAAPASWKTSQVLFAQRRCGTTFIKNPPVKNSIKENGTETNWEMLPVAEGLSGDCHKTVTLIGLGKGSMYETNLRWCLLTKLPATRLGKTLCQATAELPKVGYFLCSVGAAGRWAILCRVQFSRYVWGLVKATAVVDISRRRIPCQFPLSVRRKLEDLLPERSESKSLLTSRH